MLRLLTNRLNLLGISEQYRSAVAVLRLAALVVILGVATACSADNRGVLHTAKGDFAFNLEIADTEAQRERGLMFRTSLASDAGMLFDYHREQLAAFWMQNTLIPLDMVFIGEDGTVKTIHVNARPLDTTSIPSEVPVRFVLEIAGGRALEIGLKVGDKFEHPRVNSPVTP
jgi:uncharacterized membrane protein (UPF0127 family)